MSQHSYSRCWIHLIWGTHRRIKYFNDKTGLMLAKHLKEYSNENGWRLAAVYVNPEHTHLLAELPTNLSIEQLLKLYKGESSHWINQQRIVAGKFYWNRGYGVFSVSQSKLNTVASYIQNQKEHHQKKNYQRELRGSVEAYGLEWHEESETVEEENR